MEAVMGYQRILFSAHVLDCHLRLASLIAAKVDVNSGGMSDWFVRSLNPLRPQTYPR